MKLRRILVGPTTVVLAAAGHRWTLAKADAPGPDLALTSQITLSPIHSWPRSVPTRSVATTKTRFTAALAVAHASRAGRGPRRGSAKLRCRVTRNLFEAFDRLRARG